MFVLLVSCAAICTAHYYQVGFSHPDPKFCWCAEAVKKDAPKPMEITLQWKPTIPDEERKADIAEPPILYKPNWDADE